MKAVSTRAGHSLYFKPNHWQRSITPNRKRRKKHEGEIVIARELRCMLRMGM